MPTFGSLSAIYAIRMLRKPADSKGAGPAQINPLQIIVKKIKKQSGDGRMRAVYEANMVEDTDFLELPIYDALCNGHRVRFQPCLTHLSFKLLPEEHVMLTVLYRYHYYIEKALGNLLGLAQLLYFVARETGLGVGPLVCHSTYSVLDTEGGWGTVDAKRLIAKCRRVQDGGRG